MSWSLSSLTPGCACSFPRKGESYLPLLPQKSCSLLIIMWYSYKGPDELLRKVGQSHGAYFYICYSIRSPPRKVDCVSQKKGSEFRCLSESGERKEERKRKQTAGFTRWQEDRFLQRHAVCPRLGPGVGAVNLAPDTWGQQ